jgi:hypothetical protein
MNTNFNLINKLFTSSIIFILFNLFAIQILNALFPFAKLQAQEKTNPAIQISNNEWTPNRDANGKVLISDYSQLPKNKWLKVIGKNNKLDDVATKPIHPKSNGGDSFPSIVSAWGGAAWDTINLRMNISGGGHGDASATQTDIIAVDGTTMQISLVVAPQPVDSALKWNGNALVKGEGFPGGANYPLSTGVPGSNHTYEGLVWLPPETMTSLGLKAPKLGGIFYSGCAKAIVNLDSGEYTKLHWNKKYFDVSYLTAVRWNNIIITPRSSYNYARFDMAGTEMTDWATSGFDPDPKVPSFGKILPSFSSDKVFVYNGRFCCDMPERGEMVSFSTATSRVRYGKAETEKATNWTAFQDMITLTGATEDFTEANLKDTGTNLLSQCGAHYLHSTGEIWVCPNIKDRELYRVTGINENSWKIEKIAGTGLLTTSGQGTNGRFVVFEINKAKIAMRISSTANPIEIIRLE